MTNRPCVIILNILILSIIIWHVCSGQTSPGNFSGIADVQSKDPVFLKTSYAEKADRASSAVTLTFHITNSMISIELTTDVTFKALQAVLFHVPIADVTHMTSILKSSIAQLNTDTLRILLYDAEGDTLLPGHYIIAEIPVTIVDPSTVELGTVIAAGSDNQSISNTEALVTTTPVAVFSDRVLALPSQFELSQNYPNPFNPSTAIDISLSRESHVVVAIYTLMGQEIKTLFNGRMNAGRQTLRWDGTNRYSGTVASGTYFYRLVAEDFVAVKKMILLK